MSGPAIYENWKAQQTGRDAESAYEVPLYSDAHITSEIRDGLGPYQLLNPVALPANGEARAAVYARVEVHYGEEPMYLFRSGKTNDERYHGGWLDDEIAALLSLSLGARFRAGPVSRRFTKGADPKGKPVGYESAIAPLFLPTSGSITPVVSRARGVKALDNVGWIRVLPKLSEDQAVTVIKAARLYQDGLWIAESEPALTWIMFVSALETAAATWSAVQYTPRQEVEAWGLGQGLVDLLRAECSEETLDAVAAFLAPYVGSAQKFADFVVSNCPKPPEDRPPEAGQVSWQPAELRRVMKKVYHYRSKALHEGKPFPSPMCGPPMAFAGWKHGAEKPIGEAMGGLGSVWLATDTPILLNTFEYITRQALLNWAQGLGSE